MTDSYLKFPHGLTYNFDAPFGTWRARLDHKAWGKSKNLILYFRRVETGEKYGLSVFWRDSYTARDRKINFRDNGEAGEIYELTIKPTRTGKCAFMSARKLDPNEPPAADALDTPAEAAPELGQ